ncbi:Ferredoxin [Amycolatopsis xylanica]|uniref:Ferredoxin n=1 Tax=Amycolatopsis xylanica TaxID=589385 RepID=A0A1H3SK21_9PSEU|nr:ferredoxin [Amycolatopsis xylanica]SDZ37925.1 Ferredoxin [Amycolatopsis xylanica]
MRPYLLAAVPSAHDSGVCDIATLSGRVAYVTLCLTLVWGVLTATGWIRRVTGHHALRSGHLMLAAFTLASGMLHALAFLFLDDDTLTVLKLLIPFADGGYARHACAIIGFELCVAIAIAAGVRRGLADRGWRRLHQSGYAAVGLLMIHSWFGAIANGHLAVVWLGGITVSVPAVLLTVLRFLPVAKLVGLGLLQADPVTLAVPSGSGVVLVSVDGHRCHRYGMCQAEAPEVFQLQDDRRLLYLRQPESAQTPRVRAAARACPMRAIRLEGATP